jgi:hypothetical protein
MHPALPKARLNWRSTIVSGVFSLSALLVFSLTFSRTTLLKADYAKIRSHDDETQQWLLSWIPSTCCVTNRCCFQIKSSDVQAMPDDHWLILDSGQVLKRTDWSPDGNYWRCACDSEKGAWVVRPQARTRCLYIPMPNS